MKLFNRLKFYRITLSIGLLAVVFAMSRLTCRGESSATALTVEETIGSIFIYGPKYTSLANTNAKPTLYRLLNQPDTPRRVRGAAVIALGYTGSGVDATNLEEWLKEKLVGTLPPDHSGAVESIPVALARMASRHVSEASEILSKMSSPAYWAQTKLVAFEGVQFPHGITNEMAMRALVAYAQSGANDWKDKVQAYVAGISDHEIRTVAEWRLDTARIEQAAKDFQSVRALTVDPKTRQLFGKAFNGDFNNPRPASVTEMMGSNRPPSNLQTPSAASLAQPIQGSELSNLKKEAVTAFTNAMACLLSDDYEALAKVLADNGRPLTPVAKQTPEAIAASAEKLKAMASDMVTTKDLLRDIRSKGFNYGEAAGEIHPDGTIVVQIPCLGSREAKSRYLPRHHNTRTTDTEERLVIYMIKQDGQWYWNPFGW